MTRPRTSWACWLVELFLDLRNGYRSAKRQRALVEALKLADARYLATRPKVVRVGTLLIGAADGLAPDGFAISIDWTFWFPLPAADAMAYPATREDMDGTKRIYGYTLQELKQFHAARVEFNVDA